MYDAERRLRALETRAARLETMELTPLIGNWTPTFGGSTTNGTFTYTQQSGAYIRIGRLCHIALALQAATMPVAPTGNFVIRGLPFTASSGNNGFAIGYRSSAATVASALVSTASTIIQLYDVNGTDIAATVASASTFLVISGTYITA